MRRIEDYQKVGVYVSETISGDKPSQGRCKRGRRAGHGHPDILRKEEKKKEIKRKGRTNQKKKKTEKRRFLILLLKLSKNIDTSGENSDDLVS